jgi:Cu/Ag efflux protein CusF
MQGPSFFRFFMIAAALSMLAVPALAKDGKYEGKGEVVTVDPVYGRVTLRHGAIKGFAGDGETEFFVSSPELLRGLGRRDLIDFTVVEEKGDARIEAIEKTGVAAPEEKAGVGRVVQDVLVGTGEVAKTVTQPIAPAHEVVSGAVGATTDATGSVLREADTHSRQDF